MFKAVVMHVIENQKIRLHEGRYGEWLVLHQVLAGSCMLQLSIYTCLEPLLHYQCCFKFWVTCTLERILFLGLAVTEININYEINIKKL